MLIYATDADLTDGDVPWLPSTPANSGSLLRSASLLVAESTAGSLYCADDTGLPTDSIVLDAFTQATCAQVAQWVALGMDPLNLGLDASAPVRTKALDGASIGYDTSVTTSAQALAARQAAATELCSQAIQILREVRLLPGHVRTIG